VVTGKKMSLLRKGEAVEFTGDVKLTRGDDYMEADRMLTEEKKGLTHAWGNVYLRRTDAEQGVRWEGWGDEGAYDESASSGTLWGSKKPARLRRADLVRRSTETARSPLEIEARRLTFTRDEADGADRTRARGEDQVYVLMEEPPAGGKPARRTEVWAGRFFYDPAGPWVRFNDAYRRSSRSRRPPAMPGAFGSSPLQGADEARARASREAREKRSFPRALQREGEEERHLTGETMVYYTEEKRLSVENEARAVIVSPEERKGKKRVPAR
jgi:lipopolysaccharide export system protein LptA